MLIYQTQLEGKIFEMIEPSLQEMGYEVVRVKIMRGRGKVLQIMLDRMDGAPIAVEDCGKSSRQISSIMEIDDPIEDDYILEISSPGLERPLTREKDFLNSVGKQIKLLAYQAIEGRRRFSGVVEAFTDQTIHLKVSDANIVAEIKVQNVQEANLLEMEPSSKKVNKPKKSNDKSKR